MQNHNIVSVSGGKDSTATLLLALERGAENLKAVFADTGHEHPQTYDYLEYLEQAVGIPIRRVKADFSQRIENKRKYVMEHWANDGVAGDLIDQAIKILQPTGNPFLDLCIWKGRFPSTKVRFCSTELKVFPIRDQVFLPLVNDAETNEVFSWQGVRADESPDRAKLPEQDEDELGVINYRPILRWTAQDVFSFLSQKNVKWNPLYQQGMGRVGCMPCINCRKEELQEIAKRFPEEIERLADWERIVANASKRGNATFFCVIKDPTVSADEDFSRAHETHGIHRIVEWSNTTRGGRQFDLLASDSGECKSAYGLCEPTRYGE
jgi:3'-phosphoadenosine 5'-phosphosulfate sulfotransferase (PAPS reductase)/FAD synthetase